VPNPPRGLTKNQHQAYMDAWEGCLKRHGGKENGPKHNCYAIATYAAERAGKRKKPDTDSDED